MTLRLVDLSEVMNCNDVLKLLTLMDEKRGKRINLGSHDQLTLQELAQNAYVSQKTGRF